EPTSFTVKKKKGKFQTVTPHKALRL
ncbi:hypothetical protein Tco_1116404, partial [Tanacetum coccineum]